MSVLNTMPAPVIQMGHVEKIVEAVQNQPYVQQLVAQEEAKKTLKAESEQVAVAEKTAQSRKVRDRGEEEGSRQQQHAGPDGEPGGDKTDSPDEEGRNKNNPWAGHIVSITV